MEWSFTAYSCKATMDSFPYKGRLPSTYPACLFPNIFCGNLPKVEFPRGAPFFVSGPLNAPPGNVSEQSSWGHPVGSLLPQKVYCPSALKKIGEGKIFPGKSPDSLREGFPRFSQALFKRGWVLGGSQKTQQYQPQMGGLENHA